MNFVLGFTKGASTLKYKYGQTNYWGGDRRPCRPIGKKCHMPAVVELHSREFQTDGRTHGRPQKQEQRIMTDAIS